MQAFQQAMSILTGSHQGTPASTIDERINFQAYFSNPQATKDLHQQWRPIFESDTSISDDDLKRFLICVQTAAASIDNLIGDRDVSGVTIKRRGEISDYKTYRSEHTNKRWSLHLTESGAGEYNCVRQKLIASRGDAILLSPDALYDYQRALSADLWSHHWFYFQPKPRCYQWLNWNEVGPNIYHIKIPEQVTQKIIDISYQCGEYLRSTDPLDQDLLYNQIEEALIRMYKFRALNLKQSRDQRVEKAINFINANIERRFSIDDVAKAASLSKAQLSQLFRRQTGQTIIQWRDERRISLAAQQLLASTKIVKTIALELGYEDPLYFSKMFSRLMGVSPSEYRKNKTVSLIGDV